MTGRKGSAFLVLDLVAQDISDACPAGRTGCEAGARYPGVDGRGLPEPAAAGRGDVGQREVSATLPRQDGGVGDPQQPGDVVAAVHALGGDPVSWPRERPVGLSCRRDLADGDTVLGSDGADGDSGAASLHPGIDLVRSRPGARVGAGAAGHAADLLVRHVPGRGDLDHGDPFLAQLDPSDGASRGSRLSSRARIREGTVGVGCPLHHEGGHSGTPGDLLNRFAFGTPL